MKKLILIITILCSSMLIQSQDFIKAFKEMQGVDISKVEQILDSNNVEYITHINSKNRIVLSVIDDSGAYLFKIRNDCEYNMKKGAICSIELNLRHDDVGHLKLLTEIKKNKLITGIHTGVNSTDVNF